MDEITHLLYVSFCTSPQVKDEKGRTDILKHRKIDQDIFTTTDHTSMKCTEHMYSPQRMNPLALYDKMTFSTTFLTE